MFFSTIKPPNIMCNYRLSTWKAVDLEGDWEVGVYSLSYPHTWYTLRNANTDIHFYCDDGSGFYSMTEMDYGFYGSIQEFITDINAALKKKVSDDSIYFTYRTKTGKVTCHLTKPGHRVFIARRISLILGYAGKETIIDVAKETIIDVAKGAAQESPYVTDLSFSRPYSRIATLWKHKWLEM
jgi:hypothetical protein